MKINIPKKDITDFVIQFLQKHRIRYHGKLPMVTINCPLEKTHNAVLNTKTGVFVCETCQSWGNFNAFQKQHSGCVEIDVTSGDGLIDRLGIFSKISSNFSQGEMEVLVNKSHQKLMESPHLVKCLIDETKFLQETIRAFRVGWCGDNITDNRLQPFSNCFVIPVVSPEGYYTGLRFLGLRSIKERNFFLQRGIGINKTFWGTRPDGKSKFWVAERILDAMQLAQNLVLSNRRDICSISCTESTTGIPKEWKEKQFFGKRAVTYFSSGYCTNETELIRAMKSIGKTIRIVKLTDRKGEKCYLMDYLNNIGSVENMLKLEKESIGLK
ncbi:MAG: hypothetical protein WC947_09440 [Elusimicrobiota bacterium]